MNALSGVARWKLADLPIGSAAVGLVGAGIGDGAATVVSNFMPAIGQFRVANLNVGQAALRGAMAYGIARLDKVIGPEAATVGCLFLTASAVGTLFDIRYSISNIIGQIATGRIVTASPARYVTGTQTTTAAAVSTTSRANPGV